MKYFENKLINDMWTRLVHGLALTGFLFLIQYDYKSLVMDEMFYMRLFLVFLFMTPTFEEIKSRYFSQNK